jgi:triacylglycerol lipase
MSKELSPVQAAQFAQSTYFLRDSDDLTRAELSAPTASDLFNISGGARFVGRTGMVLRQSSGFGFLAWGKGVRQGECLIAVRGTDSGYDGATDLRFGAMPGPSGYPCELWITVNLTRWIGRSCWMELSCGVRKQQRWPSHESDVAK